MTSVASRLVPGHARLAGRVGVAGLLALLAWSPFPAAAADDAKSPPPMSEADVIHRVLPSLVNITIWKSAADPNNPGKHDESKPPEQYYGSGFIIDPSGLIMTNRHVVAGAEDIAVTFSDGSRAGAHLCAVSGLVDLAVIKIDGRKGLQPVGWGDSDKLHVGDRVLAIGNPLGVGVSVSGGIVSALHRHVSASPFDDFIQTDAAINHGNSGGALVDSWGNVVGVNTAFLSDRANGGSLGIGFAIPAFEATHAATRLVGCNYQPPGWIGVAVQEVTPDIAQSVGLPKVEGSIVTKVEPGSPASQAGLQEGDVLQTLNGTPEPTPLRMLGFITLAKQGTPVRIGYWRDGKMQEAEVTVIAWPGMETKAPPKMMMNAAMNAMGMAHGLGVHFANRQDTKGASQVVVSRIDPGSGASDAGLLRGDVVLRVAKQPVSSVDSVQQALGAAMHDGRPSVLLLLESNGRRRFVTMPLAVS